MTTRRGFLKTILAVASGSYFFSFFPWENDAKQVPKPLSASVIENNDKALDKPHLTLPVENRPFINALNHIVTPTYDGSGQSVHPSVLDFKTEHDIDSWGGFRYWMALTPYPLFNSALENPSILASKDGLNWIIPPGIKNPLAVKPAGFLKDTYNSDPELVYDPDQDILILYWREYQGNAFEKIWAKKISSSCKQSDKILCLEKIWDYKKTGLILSPTVWRKSATEWFMWTTDGRVTVHLYTSENGITWGQGQPCSSPWSAWNGGYIPWHIAAKPNHTEQTIEFLIAGWSEQKSMKDCQLLYAAAPMSQPQDLVMPLPKPLLGPGTAGRWDDGYIYRSSFVREPGDMPKFRIWYSACSKKKAWHVGYTESSTANIPLSTIQA
ncbi:hypothetical protein REC12_26510 [Desulfosporosinus sp. PR]|uniref:hypothetical protein n=1 Tax=Candidatus Desulfosporosinus nitrosoreducens TaxID=3401928 RepID=UPI0027FFA109|nr:hypothetical protein [Desulfosporosinus sp. PR]MDQ7097155.1 hypothetical protein [Desulfosporosinus sp. PR]